MCSRYTRPGNFPDDVASISYPSSSTVVFKLKKKVNPSWFTDNELTQVIPIPQQSWDKTSASGKDGNADETTKGAVAVYKYLNGQSLKLSTYASNPLWKVVDGPFELSAFTTNGQATFVPNPHYSGTEKAKIGKLVEMPYTTEDAEFNALRSGSLDYGYLPLTDVSLTSMLKDQGYSVSAWSVLGTTYMPLNEDNPTVGPMFRQTYVRQAMAHLVNQPQLVKSVLQGYGSEDYGPIPAQPKNTYAGAAAATNPFPYSPTAAKQLLTAHGWTVRPGGVTTCARPGTAANECGKGIASGAKLSFTVLYASGTAYLEAEVEALKTWFAAAGISLNLDAAPFTQVISETSPCKTGPSCSFQIGYWASPSWTYANANYYPTGSTIYGGGGAVNGESYDNATNNANIAATEASPSAGALDRYESYLSKQEPVLWLPNASHEIAVTKTSLGGALPLDPYGQIWPNQWTLSN